MGKATFMVKVINSGREKDYYDFWLRNIKTNATGENLHSALVGFTEIVEAESKHEVIALVKAKYPGSQIDAEATQRLG